MKIDYKQIWKDINNDSENSTQNPIARKLPSDGVIDIYLATDFKKDLRLIYILLENEHGISSSNLPIFNGLNITIETQKVGMSKGDFLILCQTIPQTENIFESIIADICDKVLVISNPQNLSDILCKILSEWKIFFDKNEDKILSEAFQKGLFGELTFIKNHLLTLYPAQQVFNFWTGPDAANHDFQLPNNIAIEIKTTSSKQHKKFVVNSEKQLDDTGLNSLFICLFSINLSINTPNTLPFLIREIKQMIENDTMALMTFELKLAKCGYNALHYQKYFLGFTQVDIDIFQVQGDFPRLIQGMLPQGIGDISYSVAVSSCDNHKISPEEFYNKI